MSKPTILYSAEDGIARITLNRPERLNALTREMMIALGRAVDRSVTDADVRVILLAGAAATFAHSFVKVGLSVDAGVGFALTMRLGPARARAMLMLGETLTGAEAAASGLIWNCVEDDVLTARTDALLRILLTAPATALAGIKGAIAVAVSGQGYEACLSAEARLQGRAGAHRDYAEGVLAFLEKRPANFGKGHSDD